jgi:hypothetical protein
MHLSQCGRLHKKLGSGNDSSWMVADAKASLDRDGILKLVPRYVYRCARGGCVRTRWHFCVINELYVTPLWLAIIFWKSQTALIIECASLIRRHPASSVSQAIPTFTSVFRTSCYRLKSRARSFHFTYPSHTRSVHVISYSNIGIVGSILARGMDMCLHFVGICAVQYN